MSTGIQKKNNVTVSGNTESGKSIIFAHGFGLDQTSWHKVASAFEDEYRIILYDNVGGGNSDPEAYSPNKYDHLVSYAEDLLDICKEYNVENDIMVGHSVSGMISLLANNERPRLFEKMVLVGANARYLNDGDYIGGFEQGDLDQLYQNMTNNYYAWVSGFAQVAMSNEDRPNLAKSFENTLSAIRPDIAQAVARVIFQSDHRKDLPNNTTKTLLLQTKADIAVPMSAAEYLHDNIPNSKLVVVEAEGHFPQISAPDAIIKAIKDFI